MNVLLKIAYDGTNYCGWQVQPNGITIQQVVEEAIFKVTNQKVKLIGSGRTDSGVHARAQTANFTIDSTIPPEKFKQAINAFLPKDIRVISSKRVNNSFNARFSAKQKTYIYNLYLGEENPLKQRYSVNIDYNLDFKKMKEGCKILEGRHDFKCFLSSGSEVKDTVREIYELKIIKNGCDLKVKVSGNGFLYNMVRIIVGTLISVGVGKTSLETLEKALLTGDRGLAGKTMPPNGLVLYSVSYK